MLYACIKWNWNNYEEASMAKFNSSRSNVNEEDVLKVNINWHEILYVQQMENDAPWNWMFQLTTVLQLIVFQNDV
jgi:hypothetical protein